MVGGKHLRDDPMFDDLKSTRRLQHDEIDLALRAVRGEGVRATIFVDDEPLILHQVTKYDIASL